MNIAETDTILLDFLLSVLEKQTEHKWCMRNVQNADIYIIDMEQTDAPLLYKELVSSAIPPVIIGYTASEQIKPEYTLSKPLRSSEFINLMKFVVKNHPDIGNVSLPEENIDLKVSESHTLRPDIPAFTEFRVKRPSTERLHNLLSIYQTQQLLIQVQHQGINLFIDFSRKTFYCEHRLINLSALFKSDVHTLNITEIDDESLLKLTHGISSQPLDELIWSSLLSGSCGEIDDRINEKTLLHMNQWPDFTSFLHKPEHILISACLTKQTLNLQEITLQTHTSVETATDFINACLTMGYLDIVSSIKPSLIRKKVNNTKQIDVFYKIRMKLGLKTKTDINSLLIPFPSQQ